MNRIGKRRRIASGLPGSPMRAEPGPAAGPERPGGVSQSGSGRLTSALRSLRPSKASAGPKSVSKSMAQPKSKSAVSKSPRRKEGL